MTPQQYERLTELFHAALSIAPSEREVFLDHVSESDAELRGDLQSLLAAEAAALTGKPPDDIAAAYLAGQGDSSASLPSLTPGALLGHYEIRSLLGKGGMGEVYLAEDTRLHRKVALKILPAALAANGDRIRRFQQEAQAAAALNHPNIAHIYDIGQSDNIHFIAIEHIDGDMLRDKIHRDHVPVRKLLKYLIQVAEGLSKAHEAGIVHRDLKPDNVMITRDDYAKILDFGLAKLIEPQSAPAAAGAPAREVAVIGRESSPGMVMGTAGYMSPEQALGQVKEIDQRSDIFSFGCILFEAASGRRLFAGESAIIALPKFAFENASLPESSSLNSSGLQRIIRRCLAENRDERYQTIAEVARELEDVRQVLNEAEFEDQPQLSGGTAQPRSNRSPSPSNSKSFFGGLRQRKQRAFLVAALGAIAMVASLWFLPRPEGDKASPAKSITPKRLTPDIYAIESTLSRDGRYLAYVTPAKGASSIWLKELANGNTIQTMPPNVEGYGSLQFSPDGKQIYYLTTRRGSPNGTIARIPTFGGPPQDLATDVWSPFAVSPDGKQLAFVRSSALVIAGTEVKGERTLVKLNTTSEVFMIWGSQLSWSPDGTRIAVCAGRFEAERTEPELLEISVRDGARRNLPTPAWNAIEDVAWLADGASLLVTAREKEGDPFQIWRLSYPDGETTRVTTDSNSYQGLSLTADSRTLVAEQYFSRQNIWLASFSDLKNAQQLTSSTIATDGYWGLALAGGKIIFTSPRTGNLDLWMMNEDGSNQIQLTKNAGSLNINPRVTRDGRFIVFVSSRSGTRHIWRMDFNGQNAVQLSNGPNYEEHPQLSPDGQWIYYTTASQEKPVVMRISIEGGAGTRISGQIGTWAAVPSPDGKLLACAVYIDGSDTPWKIAITSSEGGAPLQLLETPMSNPRWSSDSKSLIYIKRGTGELWQRPITGGPPINLYTHASERLYNFAISPDFQKIAYSIGNESAEAVLINDFGKE